jgi:hypothetical protein
MKNILVFLLLVVFGHCSFSQESIKLNLTDREPCFLSVVNVYVSPSVYDEKIVDEHEAGYKHRLIVILSGIYSTVYIDKIILDVEGGVNKQKWSRELELGQLYSRFSLSEETVHMKLIQWIDVDKFTFKMGRFNFEAKIVDNENILEILLIE